MPGTLRVLITGAAGQIAYSLIGPIAKGDVYGHDQPIELHLLDISQMMGVLDGVVMEMRDCSFPLLRNVVATDNVETAFKDIDYALLVGAMPRREGMERKDLLRANVKIFQEQGHALDAFAKKSVKVVVVGNPANTNALIAAHFAPSIPKANFSALTRLDQNRAAAQIAARLDVPCNNVEKVVIWGNHSNTQFVDAAHGLVTMTDGSKKAVPDAVKDDNWLRGEFLVTVQKRGAAVIAARKLSSAMSAAKAVCDHMHDWHFGTNGRWVSMGVISDGLHYGIKEGLVYSYPVTIKDGKWEIVPRLHISDWAREKMEATQKELQEERDMAMEVCKG